MRWLGAIGLLGFVAGCGPAFNNPLAYVPFVLGQPDTSSVLNLTRGMTSPISVATDGTTLFAADYQNHRTLIWTTFPTTNGASPAAVLGQPNLRSDAVNSPALSGESMQYPASVRIVGSRLIVADSANHRVLIWNSVPTTLRAPDLVLGQPNLTSNDPNDDPLTGTISARTFNGPVGVASDGTILAVADYSNNRILVWTTFPTTDQEPADFVFGQADFVSSQANQGGACSGSTLNLPNSLLIVSNTLIASDGSNDRILLWHNLSALLAGANDPPATAVIGQFQLNQCVANNNGAGATGAPASDNLNLPWGLCTNSGKLIAADRNDNRVLIWNTIPTNGTLGDTADNVVGQALYTTATANLGGVGAASLSDPHDVDCSTGNLVVADYGNNRVLVWNTIPTAPFDTADLVVGQPSFSTAVADNPVTTAARLNLPQGLASDGTRLAVADQYHNRVLLWDSLPRSTATAADVVLGQPDAFSGVINNGGISDQTLYYPAGVWTDGTRLVVADRYNNRVLIWTTFPDSDQQAADLVLGQPSMASSTENQGGVSDISLAYPHGVFSDGQRLVVADTNNNRVLIWDPFPTTDREPADVVVGQTTMGTNLPNDPSRSAATLSRPWTAEIFDDRLIVADGLNNRVLIYPNVPSSNGASASIILGQSTPTGGTANSGGRTASTMSGPVHATVHDGALYVADAGNNRVLVWSTVPTTTGAAATSVIGQPSFSTANLPYGSIGSSTLSVPSFILFGNQGYRLISDYNASRVLGLSSNATASLPGVALAFGALPLVRMAGSRLWLR